jgi:hypothetical protein
MIEHFSSIHINLVWIPEVRLKPLSDPSSRIAQPIVCLEHPASYTMYTTLGQILLCMGIYSLVYVVAYPCIVVYGHVSISRNYNSWGGIPISGSICMLMTRYVYMYLLLNLYIYIYIHTHIYIYILYVCMHVYIYIHTHWGDSPEWFCTCVMMPGAPDRLEACLFVQHRVIQVFRPRFRDLHEVALEVGNTN